MFLVARTFDFQTFNPATTAKGDTPVWVPATASVAADHLCQLIVSDAMPREVDKVVNGKDGACTSLLCTACSVAPRLSEWRRAQGR